MYDLFMTKKTSDKLFIPRGDGFDLDFYDYQSDERFQKVREFMSDRRFTVGETNVAYRVINHWDRLGVLPNGVKGDGGWRKFTLPEMVWLKVIARMRGFGLSLDQIALAKQGAMAWNAKFERYLYFEYYLTKAWFSSADPYVLVTSEGDAEVATMAEIEAAKLFLGSRDVLLISLKAILKDSGMKTPGINALLALSKKEIELLSSIRSRDSNEVKTKMNDQGEITEIESTETVTSTLIEHRIKSQVEKERMYGKVVSQYEKGVLKSVQVTRRKRLKS